MPLSKTWSAKRREGCRYGSERTRKLLQFCTLVVEVCVNFSEIEHSSGSHNIRIFLLEKQAIK